MRQTSLDGRRVFKFNRRLFLAIGGRWNKSTGRRHALRSYLERNAGNLFSVTAGLRLLRSSQEYEDGFLPAALIILKRSQAHGDLIRHRRIQQAAEPDLIGGHRNLSLRTPIVNVQ